MLLDSFCLRALDLSKAERVMHCFKHNFPDLKIISEFFYLLKFLTSKDINIHEKNGTREKVRIIEVRLY